jgi:2-polyprenyl-3-methyl-5-hydroxy-6-metoxy-1,4-benzoquinol methylase
LVKPYAVQKGLLDVGCGTGAFLNYCAHKDLIVDGVEPDEDARKFVQNNHGILVYEEDQLKKWEPQKFSAITMWHVLEHVTHQATPRSMVNIGPLMMCRGTYGILVLRPSERSSINMDLFWREPCL